MPAAIKSQYVIKQSSSTRDLGGRKLVDVYLVYNIDPTGNPFLQAEAAPGVPQYGDLHIEDTSISVQDVSCKPFLNAKDKAWVYISYGRIENDPSISPVFEIHSARIPVKRVVDGFGHHILVKYTRPAFSNPGDVELTPATPFPDWFGQMDGFKSLTCFQAQWTEVSDPSGRLKGMMNKISSGTFRGDPKWTWFVNSLDIVKVRYKPGFLIRLELIYDEETWIQTIPYRDSFGVIPKDVDLAGSIAQPASATSYNGYFRASPTGEASFDTLGIPFTGSGLLS